MESVPHSETFDPGEGRGLAILGSTGSIGTQALDVVRAQPGRFRVEVLTAGRLTLKGFTEAQNLFNQQTQHE